MKVLMLNGSPKQDRCTMAALKEVEKTLNEQGIETEIVQIGSKQIKGCTACGYCKINGLCVFNDEVNEVSAKLHHYDAVVVGTPVYYSNPNGTIITFLDRLFYSSAKKMHNKLGAVVVSARRAGTTSSIDVINKFFMIANMPVVSSQYWNMVHGNTVEEVMQDEEGMQIMRQLGRNMAWLLWSINAGREAGLPLPEQEERIATNFIR